MRSCLVIIGSLPSREDENFVSDPLGIPALANVFLKKGTSAAALFTVNRSRSSINEDELGKRRVGDSQP